MIDQGRIDRARKFMEQGDFESSLKAFHELYVEGEDSESKFNGIYGEPLSLLSLRRTAEARRLIKVVRKTFGDIDEAMARVEMTEVQIDSEEGKWDRVLPALERMVDRYGDILHDSRLRDVYEQVQLKRGMRLAYLGRFREAFPFLKEALEFDPSVRSGEFYYELARCYSDAGDNDRATEAFQAAFNVGLDDSRTASAHWNIAVMLMQQDSHARALEELKLAEQSANASGFSKEHIYKGMAIALFKLGMKEEAKRYAKMAETIR